VAELTRGTVGDRPWGRTLAALGLRGVSGQLTLTAEGKRYEIAFGQGAIVGAMSPLASDSAARVAMTGGLVSTTQVAELARRQAAAPQRDEVETIADHLQLGFDQAMRLRRRTIAQRAARTFSIDRGEFVVTDAVTLPVVAGSELDVRTVIYIGARQNLSEVRLASELGLLGSWYRLKPEAFDDLPQFGFGQEERPIVDQLMNGASLAELEAIVGVDPRTVRAVVYALACANACNIEHARGGTQPPATARRPSTGAPRAGTQPAPGRATTTTPPTGTGAVRMTTPTSSPVVRTAPPTSSPGVARTVTPTSVPRSSTGSSPGVGRSAGPSSSLDGTNTPMRGASTQAPATARASISSSPPPTSRPAPTSSAPRGSSTVAPTPSRTASATRAPLAAVPASLRRSVDPALVREVQTLVDERVALMERQADHYAMLGIAPGAAADDLRKAYFGLARQLHPDRLAALGVDDSNHVAHKVFAQLNTAFSVLSDPKRRADYDQLAASGGEDAQREEQQQAEAMTMRILEAEEHYKRGELALKRDDLATASAELARAIELNADEADYHALHAWAVFCAAPDKNTVARQTRTTLERAIQKSPKAVQARFLLGRVERMLGRDQIALQHFKDVLVDKPQHHEAKSEIRAIEARLQSSSGSGLFGRKR